MNMDALSRALDETRLHRDLGLSIVAFDDKSLLMRMPLTELAERAAGSGQFHGGAIATLIDVAGDFVLMAELGYGVPTINFRVDYLRPATGAALIARASARRVGRTVAVADVDVLDEQERVVAIGRGCYGAKAG